MFKIFKDSFKITNDSIILATPLIVFLSIIGGYLYYAINAANSISKIIVAFITLIVMICGLLAAWLYMVKKTIALSKRVFVFDKDRVNALIDLIWSLPKGIGRLFLPMLGVVLTSLFLYFFLFISAYVMLTAFNHINLLSITENIIMVSVSFLTLLWIPEIIYLKKNFVISLFKSIFKVFSKFWNSLILYIFMSVPIISIAWISTKLIYHPIVSFFVLLIYYYLLVYIVVLLFTYYERTFLEE